MLLIIGLSITYGLDEGQRQSSFDALSREFAARSQDIFERIRERLGDYAQVLRGGTGLFAGSKGVSREEWRKYAGSLKLEQNLPGIQGIGFAQFVRHEDKSAHVEAVRREGFQDYAIRPDGQRDFYTPVVYLEPFSGRNLRAFGYDMHSEAVRRQAMDAALDENRLAMSGKVKLVQETEGNAQPGFLMYAPIYRNGAPTATVTERREALSGWVYAPFRMTDFMNSIVGDGFSLKGISLDIHVFDGDGVDMSDVMFDFDHGDDALTKGSKPPLLMFRHLLTFGGHSWTVVVHTPMQFDAHVYDNWAVLIAVSGSAISLLTAVLSWLLISGSTRRRTHGLDGMDRMTLSDPSGYELAGRAAPYALAAAMSLAAGYVVWKSDESDRQAWSLAERTNVENQLNIVRLSLERTLSVPMIRTRGMAAQIIAHGDVLPAEFSKLADVLVQGSPTIRNIGVSHGTRLDLIYPLAGNEGAIGVDYRTIDRQWPAVKRAIETRSAVVEGPVTLIQGGQGLIIREPIYLSDDQGGNNHLFGLVSIVLDIPTIYAEAGLDRDDLPIEVAIRGRDGLGDKGDVFWGDSSILSCLSG